MRLQWEPWAWESLPRSHSLALLLALLFSLPSLDRLLPFDRWWRLSLLGLLLIVLATGLWQLRGWIPPATLRLVEITLTQQIDHLWLHNGALVDRLTLDIRGGRAEGYRAWTHKRNFPADAVGRWQPRVVTDSGQLIGLADFTVTAAEDSGAVN